MTPWLWCALLGAAPPSGSSLYDPMEYQPPLALRDAGPVSPTRPALPFVWDLPPKTVHQVPIDGTTRVDGVPVRMRYLLVKGTPPDIGLHFLESFKRQGLYVALRQAIDRQLTGVDPEAIITYSVVLQPNEGGHTTVILGESRPLDRKNEANGLPLPPGVRGVIPVSFEGRTVLSFKVARGVDEVKRFYAQELPLRGFRPGADEEWLKPGARLQLKVRPDGNETQVVLEQQQAK